MRHGQSDHPWQVIVQWIFPAGTEHVQIAAFPTYAEVLAEVDRLSPSLGRVVGDRILKSVQISGDFKELTKTIP